MSNPDPKAQMRMNVIMRVQNREITATQGAEELGISRKTYYEWENRALLSLHKTLSDRPAGRPEKEFNPYVEELENKIKNLSQQVLMLEQEREIRDILQGELRQWLPSRRGIRATAPRWSCATASWTRSGTTERRRPTSAGRCRMSSIPSPTRLSS